MKSWSVITFLSLSVFGLSNAQTTLFNVEGRFDNISTISVGDTVLFRYEDETTGVMRSVWICDSTSVHFEVPNTTFAAIHADEGVYLYYAEKESKVLEVNAAIIDPKTINRYPLDSTLHITGYLIGSIVDKGNLYFILLGAGGLETSIFEVNKMNVVSKTSYELPNNVADYFKRDIPVEFYTKPTSVNSFKGRSKIKFYRYDGKFFITVDRIFDRVTELMKLDPVTKAVSVARFKCDSRDFTSFFLDGKLFRTSIDRRKITISVLDVLSGEILSKTEVTPADTVTPIFFRYNGKHVIHDHEKLSGMLGIAAACDATISVIEKDGHYVIQSGTYYNQKQVVFAGANVLSAIASVVITTILQSMEGPGVSRYFYHRWDGDGSTISLKNPSEQTIREKIDRYEIEQGRRNVKYDHKSYIAYRDGVLATYYDSKNASLVYFE